VWNAVGRFQGQLDSDLDPTGVEALAAAATVLAALTPDLVVTSSAGRARASAGYVERALGLTAAPDDRLREIHLGAWQGLTRDEAASRYPGEYDAWVRGDDVRRGDGETYAEVSVRAGAALDDALALVPAGGLLVAVTHGGTARAVIGSALGLAPSDWWRFAPLGNARWSVLLETERGYRLAEHNAGVTERYAALVEAGDDARPVETVQSPGR
jgi:broad specificity phosphatase PhoE